MEDLTGVLGVLVPLSAIVLGIGVAFWSIYWDHQKKRLQYQERQLMIERGMVPPPDLPDQKRIVTPEDSLRRGIERLSIGIGLAVGAAILSHFTNDREFVGVVSVAAAIVGFLGLGSLAYYYISRRKTSDISQ